jgi:hypothetical protein
MQPLSTTRNDNTMKAKTAAKKQSRPTAKLKDIKPRKDATGGAEKCQLESFNFLKKVD